MKTPIYIPTIKFGQSIDERIKHVLTKPWDETHQSDIRATLSITGLYEEELDIQDEARARAISKYGSDWRKHINEFYDFKSNKLR